MTDLPTKLVLQAHAAIFECQSIKPLAEFWIRGGGGRGNGYREPGRDKGRPITPCKACQTLINRERENAERRDDEAQRACGGRTWEQQMEHETGIPSTGPI